MYVKYNFMPDQPQPATELLPAFIDVEASGFGRGSYPIEVGIALGDGEMHCSIIRPDEAWTHWDLQAEQLHGISREVLIEHGTAPRDVAVSLNGWLQGQTVYSDAWGNDSSWLALLFESAGIPMRFRIDSLRSIVAEQQLDNWHDVKQLVIDEYQMRRHRASSDALVLQETYRRIMLS